MIDEQNKKGFSFTKFSQNDFPNKNILYFLIQEGILKLTSSWKKEGEWIIKKDKITGIRNFKVPMNSKLYFKISINDSKEIERIILSNKYGFHSGINDENLKLVTDMIENFHLNKLYDIEFIEGYMKTFDIWKDEPIPETIPYAQLMKNVKGFTKKK